MGSIQKDAEAVDAPWMGRQRPVPEIKTEQVGVGVGRHPWDKLARVPAAGKSRNDDGSCSRVYALAIGP